MSAHGEILIVPILYSELFGTKPTRAELEGLLSALDWRHVVMFAVGIECISFLRHGVEDRTQQQRLTAEMASPLLYGPHRLSGVVKFAKIQSNFC